MIVVRHFANPSLERSVVSMQQFPDADQINIAPSGALEVIRLMYGKLVVVKAFAANHWIDAELLDV